MKNSLLLTITSNEKESYEALIFKD